MMQAAVLVSKSLRRDADRHAKISAFALSLELTMKKPEAADIALSDMSPEFDVVLGG